MKILLFSDSHGYTLNMEKAIKIHKDADIIVHLGDFVRDAAKLQGLHPRFQWIWIRGNNDWAERAENEKILEIEGKRILVTHGHLYGVKAGYTRLVERGEKLDADAVFFGHTHVSCQKVFGKMLLVNPGSIGRTFTAPRPEYSLVIVEAGGIRNIPFLI